MDWIEYRSQFDGQAPEGLETWDNTKWEFKYRSVEFPETKWIDDTNDVTDKPLWFTGLIYAYRERDQPKHFPSPRMSMVLSYLDDLSLEEKVEVHKFLEAQIEKESDWFYQLAKELVGEPVEKIADRLREELIQPK